LRGHRWALESNAPTHTRTHTCTHKHTHTLTQTHVHTHCALCRCFSKGNRTVAFCGDNVCGRKGDSLHTGICVCVYAFECACMLEKKNRPPTLHILTNVLKLHCACCKQPNAVYFFLHHEALFKHMEGLATALLACARAHAHTLTHTRTHTHTYAHTRTHTCTHTRTYTCTCTHKYTRRIPPMATVQLAAFLFPLFRRLLCLPTKWRWWALRSRSRLMNR